MGKTRARKEWLGPCSYTRNRIQAAKIIDRLQSHVYGEVNMSPSQVAAAMGLLRKVLPDLQAIEHKGNVDSKAIVQVISYARDTMTLHQMTPGGELALTDNVSKHSLGGLDKTGGREKLTSTPHLQPQTFDSSAETVIEPENSPDLPK